MAYYPVFLEVRERRCIVCGGGNVALRKVEALLRAEALVTVIAPEVCPELAQMADDRMIAVTQREYREGDLEGAFVVVAATDDREANRGIAADARKHNCLVNAVDDAGCSDFIVPAAVNRGPLTIAVSTGGRSPALARKLRTLLETRFGEDFGELVTLIGDVRAELKHCQRRVDEETWQRALDLDALAAELREQGPEAARKRLISNLTEGDL